MAIWEVKQAYRSEWRDKVVGLGPGMLVVPAGEEHLLPPNARATWRIAVMEPDAVEYVRRSSPETLVEFTPASAPAPAEGEAGDPEGERALEQPPHDRMVKSPSKKRGKTAPGGQDA